MRKRVPRADGQVFAVTSLPASLKDDQAGRMHRYLWSMGIRTASFILAVLALGVLHWTVVGWVFVIAAVILPYVAVVVANAKNSHRSTGGTALGPVTSNTAAPQLSARPPDMEPPDEPGSVQA